MNIILNAIGKPDKVSTSQTGNLSVEGAMEIYLKNAYVSLCSAKMYNPSARCVLCLNFDLDRIWNKRFIDNDVEVINIPFQNSRFQISSKYNWSIIQYKYHCLDMLLNDLDEDDSVLMIDTDTICVDSLDELFEESKCHLLLFDVQHRLHLPDRENILNNYAKIYGKKATFNHFGGEFICGNKRVLSALLDKCEGIIVDANKIEDLINWNDEHIISIAVNDGLRSSTINGNAYIYRYWTKHFYLVSTNFENNPVCIWHLPDEKNDGIIMVFDYMIKKGKLPSVNTMADYFGFIKPKRRNNITIVPWLWMKIKSRM